MNKYPEATLNGNAKNKQSADAKRTSHHTSLPNRKRCKETVKTLSTEKTARTKTTTGIAINFKILEERKTDCRKILEINGHKCGQQSRNGLYAL